ncbi:helix-turn-helix domain-containing protein [Tahibacter aquaticus]|uniref:helix-turn-helix domain-containing protein n=1 Tax=Tahibacter aquaticus TaxID=520092 RepID=UPI001061324D|nr:helix-turn-helix transcriptional regulator [Tahibacter aquaticus]
MPTFEQALGQVIATERKRLGLTQEALAEACGVHTTYVSQLERGLKSPTVRVVRSLASVLKSTAASRIAKAEKA